MILLRDAWYEEIGGAPPGNKLALERNQWLNNKTVDVEVISNKAEAAQLLADQLSRVIRRNGCKEEILANPKTLLDGEVEFIRKSALSPDALREYEEAVEYKKKATLICKVMVEGEEQEFSIFYHSIVETNGGIWCDITVKYKAEESQHRIIVGKDYYEPYGIFPEQVVERTIGFMLIKKILRATEGILDMNVFPSNYFSVSDIHNWYPEFEEMFHDLGIDRLVEGYWNMNRSNRWVAEFEDLKGLNIALGRDEEGLMLRGLLEAYG